ncbi:AraC family transcriptional regulator [Candidatus Litorirhabdus singularis]|uniref:AraC family transcriptional regulator n=1 Tax=Candidatus Litorirhabdus singularis TaxID=2518993 RepID=UPI00242DE3B1|nr:AraC family transcriptional regulator [Candidatus Litorirhabdus singularis]
MNIPLIHTKILSRTVEIADQLCSKQDIDSCLRTLSLSREAISGNSFLPYDVYAQFEAAASRKLGDSFFGVTLTKHSNYLDLGAYAEYVLAASCLGDALKRGGNALSLINPGARVDVSDADNHVILSFNSGLKDLPGAHYIDQGMPLLLTEIPRYFLGQSWTPVWVGLPRRVLSGFDDAESMYSATCRYLETGAAIAIKKSDLEAPNPRKISFSETPLFGDLKNWLTPSGIPTSTHDQVKNILDVQLRIGDVAVDTIANRLRIGPRSLQRRLKTEGFNFREVLSEARHMRAKKLLEESQFPISEVAYGLGYEEVNSFRRAFMNREGCTPTQYAAQHRVLAVDLLVQ